jgi:NAD(P)-dependent dehydrogenase (short-subunit alcohol dehydrogenase family)
MAEKILITGASSGFGVLIVRALLEEGHAVAGSMREPGGRNAEIAALLREEGAHVVEIDVTDADSVERGVAAAREALGGLTVLINNAGVGVTGLVEAFTDADFQRLFDVNVFGVQRMNRAVAPVLRAQRRGLIVHVSSLLGRVTMPFYGPYNASKWAVEALAENYRSELSAFGVQSVVVEPGGYPTTFMDNLMRPSDAARAETYGPLASAPEEMLHGFHELLSNSPAQDPRNVARAVAGLVAAAPAERPFRTVVDSIGMGAGVERYNHALAELTDGLYGNMGIGHMLHTGDLTG